MAELRTSAPPNVPIVLVGTKIDRRNAGDANMVSTSEGSGMQKKNGFAGHVECSAKTLNNYKAAFDKAIIEVIKKREDKKSKKPIKQEGKKKPCTIF